MQNDVNSWLSNALDHHLSRPDDGYVSFAPAEDMSFHDAVESSAFSEGMAPAGSIWTSLRSTMCLKLCFDLHEQLNHSLCCACACCTHHGDQPSFRIMGAHLPQVSCNCSGPPVQFYAHLLKNQDILSRCSSCSSHGSAQGKASGHPGRP